MKRTIFLSLPLVLLALGCSDSGNSGPTPDPGLSEGGFYWSSAQYPDYSYYAYGLYFYSSIAGCYDRGGRESGHTVRPVLSN